MLAIGARVRDISLHFANLLRYRELGAEEAEACFKRARTLAETQGVSLSLPPLHAPANSQRACPFIEQQAAFIAQDGEVMPCHFLWHSYGCMVNQSPIQVRAHSFGNIRRQSLQSIWRDPRYAAFRAEAGGSEYAPCWSCSSGPCADLVNPNLLGMSDCYGSLAPCGHCMWSLGWTQCL